MSSGEIASLPRAGDSSFRRARFAPECARLRTPRADGGLGANLRNAHQAGQYQLAALREGEAVFRCRATADSASLRSNVDARAILAATERPVSDIVASGTSRVVSHGEGILSASPTESWEEARPIRRKTENACRGDRADNCYEPVSHDGGERGNFDGRMR